MQITGTVENILPKETKGNYSFRNIWVKTKDQYPQMLSIECGGKKSDLFDSLSVGQTVTIDINLQGREYNGKVYNKISAWKVTVDSENKYTTPINTWGSDVTKDDLPF